MLLNTLNFDARWFGTIKDSTLENHRTRFEILKQALPNINLGKKKDVDKIIAYVNDRYDAPSNVYSTLLKMFRALNLPRPPLVAVKTKPTFTASGEQTMSENEQKLWVDWVEVRNAFKRLYYSKPTEKEAVNDLLVLGLYVLVPPRRNDYRNMKHVAVAEGLPATHNYCCRTTKRFYFHVYKTSGKYGVQIVDIPPRLWKIIKYHHHHYHKHHQFARSSCFLFGKEMTSVQFSDMVQATTLRRLKKEIGSRMLRKIYLTHLHQATTERARQMGHSVRQSYAYVRADG